MARPLATLFAAAEEAVVVSISLPSSSKSDPPDLTDNTRGVLSLLVMAVDVVPVLE